MATINKVDVNSDFLKNKLQKSETFAKLQKRMGGGICSEAQNMTLSGDT